jgi:hypothetical protein
VFDILDFGAVPDDDRDDTAAIQAALDAAHAAGGGKVVVPSGSFVWSPQAGPLRIYSGTTLEGSGDRSVLKVCNAAGAYGAMLTQGEPVVHDVVIARLRFDQNVKGNPAPAPVPGAAGKTKWVIALSSFADVRIEDNTFDEITGVNAVTAYGRSSSGLQVIGNRFKFVPTGDAAYDNSALYLDCQHHVVSANVFRDASARLARGAVESHSGPGALTGNVSWDYETFARAVTEEGDAPASSSTNITISGNTIHGAGRAIDLWAITGRTLRNVAITGNTIFVANAARASPNVNFGVGIARGLGLAGGIDGVVIANNVLRFERETRRKPYDSIGSGGIVLYGESAVENVIVQGNLITDSPTNGVRVDASASSMYRNVRVVDNTFVNAGNDSSQMSRAALVTNGLLKSVIIDGNHVEDTGTPRPNGTVSWAIYAAPGSTIRFSESNTVSTASGGLAESTEPAGVTATGARNNLTYAPSVSVDASKGSLQMLAVPDGSPFTIENPTGASWPARTLTFVILNRRTPRGPTGPVSWGSAYRQSDLPLPKTIIPGAGLTITFTYDGQSWQETSRALGPTP